MLKKKRQLGHQSNQYICAAVNPAAMLSGIRIIFFVVWRLVF